ncbi:hypothetical protein vseg_014868 [Gypsophila vaccaria]
MDHQPPPSKVPTTAVESAVTALLNWKTTSSTSSKPQLLPTDEFVYLIVTLTKIPAKSRVNAYKLPLPHALYTAENAEYCLFVHDDKSKTAKKKIEEESLPITKVIKLSKLRKEYKAHEQKRKLCDSYDVFLAEKGIVPLLPNVLGKWFYKKKKVPVRVELRGGRWGEKIERIGKEALLYLSTGSCCVVKVARATMTRGEIVENVVAAVEGVGKVVKNGWGGVRSLNLKLAESVALPLYQAVPEAGFKIGGAEVVETGKKATKEKAMKEKAKAVVEGEKKSEEKMKMKMKKKKVKGRIHEVRYMDDEVVGGGEDGNEDEDEDDEVVDEVKAKKEKEEVKEEVVGKKRKKGGVVKKAAVTKGEELKKKKKKEVEVGGKKVKKSKVSV